MKKIVALLLAMALVLSLCAFAQAEEITLRVLAGQSTTDAGIEDMIDEALAQKYPEIKLEWECVDWGNDFQPKMQVYMQSGLPDIMIGKAQDVATYGSLGLLADLTEQPYMDNILDAAKEGVTLNGKVLGMTFNCLYQGVYYSREIFANLGLEVPKTHEELAAVIETLKANGITPFASHMVDTWSIGNVTMQFAVNDVFNKYPTWGDMFRAGEVSFETSEEYKTAYEYNKLIYDNTWTDETFSLEQTACDAKMVMGEAAMKVSGSWSIQNFLGIDETYDFGIFPFPNQTGDAKLLFEPNITFMASASSAYQDAINKVFEVIATDKDLQVAIYDYTMTAPMVKDVAPTFANPSQSDIDAYAAAGMIQDVNLGNNQLVWGGFQEENAKDIAEYLQGHVTIEEVLKASDARRANSK
ncbi:MAG: ABC transporter substrate-binding protein [Candidatus Ventricola sp.]